MKRIVSRAALLLAIGAAAPSAFATNYYFSGSAGAGGNGTAASPWSSLTAADSLDLNPGDNLYLKGSFNSSSGGILLGSQDAGTSAAPVTITNWSGSAATINAGDSYGIEAKNVGGISISNLTIQGSGSTSVDSSGLYTNTNNGILFDTNTGKQNFVRVNNVNVSGFGENGIYLRGNSGSSGFNDVKITNSVVSQNQRAGLAIDADYNYAGRDAHSNVLIDHVTAANNYGRATSVNEGHSGEGIVIGQVNGATIQHSIAYGNGTHDASTQGGSVGIWAWDANDVTIQYNESHNNGTAGQQDGGGFDLDGGVTNSVMRHNYSHDNAGAGYLLAEFSNARNSSGNTVANNISVNDGRKNGYGAIHAFGAIDSATVTGNTVFISPSDKGQANTRDESPAAVKLRGSQSKNIDITGNVLIVQTDGSLAKYQPTEFENENNASGITFNGNTYQPIDGGATDAEALAVEGILGQLGDQLAAGKSVAIDADALDAYLKSNPDTSMPVDTTPKRVQVADDMVASVGQVSSAPTPEPAAMGILAIGAVGLLRRRRRAI